MKLLMFFMAVWAYSSNVNPDETYISVSSQERFDAEEYHESDDLLYQSDSYLIYLNQTSPVTDTVYVISIVK